MHRNTPKINGSQEIQNRAKFEQTLRHSCSHSATSLLAQLWVNDILLSISLSPKRRGIQTSWPNCNQTVI